VGCLPVPKLVVITDILMPEQDGLETITGLHREFPEVKIIAISGSGRMVHMDFLDVAERFGAQCTLHKPVAPHGLITAVHALLQG
jgi:DNA-binding NarL/FixJ family response regulator